MIGPPRATRPAKRWLPTDFTAGDVVTDEELGTGIVTEVRERSLTVVFTSGARAGGPGLLDCILHHEPRHRVEVPPGALGNRGWNREQAVTAVLRRAGVLS